MGCDIHFAIEVKEADGWRDVPYLVEPYLPRNDERDSTGYWGNQWKFIDDHPEIAVMPREFRNRNYMVFGTLANVRVETPNAIAPDRGFPSDATRREHEPDDYDDEATPGRHWLGDHSFTWIGLDELKAFDTAGDKTPFRWIHNWFETVIPALDKIAAGRPLRLLIGFDN